MDFCRTEKAVEKICLACHVPLGFGESIHKSRPSHGVAFYVEGESVYRFESGERLTTKKNDLIFLPQSSDYTVKSVLPSECYAINFLLTERELSFEPTVLHMENTGMAELFKSAEKAFSTQRLGYAYHCTSCLYSVFYEMLRVAETAYTYKKKETIIRPAVDYIHEHFLQDDIRVEELAELCGISAVYLRRLFVGKFGVSPNRYIARLRTERAKNLLSSELYSVESVCALSGYRDISYFCRTFKKETGRTPSEYRAGLR